MSRHQHQLTLVHKHQQELENRLRNMASMGSVSRPVATALHEQLAKSGTELDLAERHLRELEQHYFVAREYNSTEGASGGSWLYHGFSVVVSYHWCVQGQCWCSQPVNGLVSGLSRLACHPFLLLPAPTRPTCVRPVACRE